MRPKAGSRSLSLIFVFLLLEIPFLSGCRPPVSFGAMLDETLENLGAQVSLYPGVPNPDNFATKLLEIAQRAATQDKSAEMLLIERVPDTALASRLVERQAARMENPDLFCRWVWERFPDTLGGARALELDLAAGGADCAHVCNKVLIKYPKSKCAFSALASRAQHNREDGERLPAALDSLRMLLHFRADVEASALVHFATGNLEQGGFLAESAVLLREHTASSGCTFLEKELARIGSGPGFVEKDNPASPTDLYYSTTPDVATLLEKTRVRDTSGSAWVIFWARVLMLTLKNDETFAPVCKERFLQCVGSLEPSNASEDEVAFACLINYELYKTIEEIARTVVSVGSSSNGLSNEGRFCKRLLPEIAGVQVALLNLLYDRACQRGVEAAEACCVKIVDFCQEAGLNEQSIEARRKLASAFSSTAQAARCLYDLAEFYRGTLTNHAEACRIFAMLIDDYGNMPEAGKALLARALMYYQDHDYVSSMKDAELYCEHFGQQQEVAIALLVLAMDLAALEDFEAAEQTVLTLRQDYAQNPHTPRALLWLCALYVNQQELTKAKDVARDILEAYTASTEAVSASKLLGQLDAAAPDRQDNAPKIIVSESRSQ